MWVLLETLKKVILFYGFDVAAKSVAIYYIHNSHSIYYELPILFCPFPDDQPDSLYQEELEDGESSSSTLQLHTLVFVPILLVLPFVV